MTQAGELKEKHRALRDTQSEDLRVRLHRALSWLGRAQEEKNDLDARFAFLWIAFNAAYAQEFGFESTEREQTREFIGKIVARDTERRIDHALFKQFSGPIRTLMDNKFVFEPFWRAMRAHDASDKWREQLEESKRLAMRATLDHQADVLLGLVLDRLYVLRNQIIHGGSTWNSEANREQLRDGAAILDTILPVILDVMITDQADDYPPITFPWVRY